MEPVKNITTFYDEYVKYSSIVKIDGIFYNTNDNLEFIINNLDKITYIKKCNYYYETYNSIERWFLNFKLHNLDSYATYYKFTDGTSDYNYFIDGKLYNYELWLNHPKKLKWDRFQKLKKIVN